MNRDTMYLAMGSGKVPGFASWRRVNSRLAELSGVIVLEGCKGKEIGSMLVEKILKDARDSSYDSIGVKTEEYNTPAIAFYKKCGFAPH